MKRYILAILFILFASHVWAEPISEDLVLSKAPINRSDMESIKRGAKFFANNCMVCHSMVYLKYDKLAQEAGITIDKMPLNVKTWPNGVTPPDLSLEGDVRGADWLYTYFHSFYKDPSRPTGANNLLVHNSAMPAILAPYQGEQTLVQGPTTDSVLSNDVEWYYLIEQTGQGSMSPEQFDETTADLVNFLMYASEPFYGQQHAIGKWVLAFLAFMFIFAYLLKVEYWKDVKKHKKD